MSKTARTINLFGDTPEIAVAAIRQIADKSRFGVFYYLFGLIGIFSVDPNLTIKNPVFAALLAAFFVLLVLRELAYRFSLREGRYLLWTQRCLESSYLLNGVAWGVFSFIVLQSAQGLSGTAAAT